MSFSNNVQLTTDNMIELVKSLLNMREGSKHPVPISTTRQIIFEFKGDWREVNARISNWLDRRNGVT
jgi:hypothetical protein